MKVPKSASPAAKSPGISAKSTPAKKRTYTRKNFNKLLLNGVEYRIGDVVVVKELQDDRSFGRVLRIWREPGEELQAFIRLRWFYKPENVFTIVPDFVGADELFESDHEQDVYVQTINGKIRVITLAEYLHLENMDSDVFFTRAKYCAAGRRLEPPEDAWARVCVCKTILSPNDEYLRCERCDKRFHPLCVKEAMSTEWVCGGCKNYSSG